MDANILKATDPRELGRRLQEARKARGLTQQDAASHLGVARTTITALEKGERRIQPSELARLATLYARSIGELLRRGEPIEAFSVQLRAVLAPNAPVDTEVEPHTWDFQQLCENYLELEHLSGAALSQRYPAQYQIGGIAPEDVAEDVAVAERNRLGLGDGPVLNLRDLLENDVGLRIFYMDLPSRVSAMFAYTERLGGCIAVNRKHPEERRRMSMGHDYGHFLTNRYRPEITFLGRYQRQPEHERFAETFARAFLMPAAGLSRRFNELQRSRKGGVTAADLCILAYSYFVSVEALALRLEEIRLLPAGTWDRLKQAGFKVREAQALLQLRPRPSADQKFPRRYLYLAIEAYERADLSEGQLARFLRADRIEARRLASELANDTVVSDDGTVGVLPLDLGATLPPRSG